MLQDKIRKNVKVYGPYVRKDGRKHVVIYNGKHRQTMSYPKWLKEQELGYELGKDDTIDHDDRNFNNNETSNLVVRPRPEHARLDAKRVEPVIQYYIWCGKELKRQAKDIRRNSKKGKAGPFCKPCAGTYGAMKQNGKIDKLEAQESVKPTYYKLDKSK